jgi:hypothetical protein
MDGFASAYCKAGEARLELERETADRDIGRDDC